jgi:hypothetical protein
MGGVPHDMICPLPFRMQCDENGPQAIDDTFVKAEMCLGLRQDEDDELAATGDLPDTNFFLVSYPN